MSRRKLIFFTSADPRTDPATFSQVYHFANVAGKAGLEAEVRLAGPAVDVVDQTHLPTGEQGDEARTKIIEGVDGPFLVSL
ncbi:MAG: hypothetical protein ACR2QK_10905 [Acidimicrobiales bacterium]